MANGDQPSKGGFSLDPIRVADLAMNIINKVGLPLVLLGIVMYWLAPAHLEFLETATREQKKQTEIVSSLKTTAEKALESDSDANARIEALTKAIGTGDRQKLESLEGIEAKLDQNGKTLDAVHQKVDAIKASVNKS